MNKFKSRDPCGRFIVYRMYCKGNDKSYIGITKNFKNRIALHWKDGRHNNTVLCRTIRKYGKESFVIIEIDNAETWDKACGKEVQYIKHFNTKVPNGLNMTDGGEGISGLIHSEKVIQQMCENQRVRTRQPFQGKRHTEESKEKTSRTLKGRFIGKLNPMYGRPGPRLGVIVSEETCRKISLAKKGTKCSEEARQKISEGNKGKQVGEKNTQARLTETNVIDIRSRYAAKEATQYQLAEEFGVTQSNINCVIKRVSWGHI